MRTLVLLHGFGVRGFFFEPIKTMFESRFTHVFNPDLDMVNSVSLIESTNSYFETLKNNYPTSDIYIIGHSLGGILASLIAKKLGPNVIKKIAIISSPYESQKIPFKRLTRFLIIHQLIPGFLSRPRFFSSHTPSQVQKRIWRQVVPETESMVDEILSDQPFYSNQISELDQDTIVLGSESDKIVSFENTKKLAEIIKAKEILFYKKDRNIHHNDFITGPMIAQEISEKITTFFLGKKDIWD